MGLLLFVCVFVCYYRKQTSVKDCYRKYRNYNHDNYGDWDLFNERKYHAF